MPQVTNNSRQSQTFAVGNSKDGGAKTQDIGPGETKDMDLDMEDVEVKAAIHTSLITVGGQAGHRRSRSTSST